MVYCLLYYCNLELWDLVGITHRPVGSSLPTCPLVTWCSLGKFNLGKFRLSESWDLGIWGNGDWAMAKLSRYSTVNLWQKVQKSGKIPIKLIYGGKCSYG